MGVPISIRLVAFACIGLMSSSIAIGREDEARDVRQAPIETAGPNGPLAGTLTTPDDRGAPVILIIPGSGPTDRNGNTPTGIAAAPYRLLAEGLAAKGIASVRIDKRGMFGSQGAVPDPDGVTMGDYATDIRAWITTIRKRTGTGCIWLLGHSEGGVVALHGGGGLPDVCGLILVSTPGRPLGAVLREQLHANPANAPILPEALSILERLERGEHVDGDGMHPALAPLFRPSVQGFLISALALDPAKLVSRIGKPVLIVQGLRDIQVGAADAERLKQAEQAARLVMLPDVNHVLKTVASDGIAENIATYADPTLPLAPGIIDQIAEFVRASTPAR